MNSLKGLIIEYARTRQGDWINGGELEKLAMTNHYKASNCGRRCRELENLGILERRLNENKCVEYRYLEAEVFNYNESNNQIIAGTDFSESLNILKLL